MGTQYKADISPKEAWELLSDNDDAVLVDVRTENEWALVGVPDLSDINKKVIFKEWRLSEDMSVNPKFLDEMQSEVEDKSRDILFLCRSGGRSAEAATLMTQMGYENCYNIQSGFEGEPDDDGQRGTIDGWKHDKLPWRQN